MGGRLGARRCTVGASTITNIMVPVFVISLYSTVPYMGCPIFFHLGLEACAALAQSLRALARTAIFNSGFPTGSNIAYRMINELARSLCRYA